MKQLKFFCLAVSLGLFCAGPAAAGDTGSHVVAVDVQPINEIRMTGSPSLTISGAIAGQQPFDATHGESTCAVTTNGSHKRITAALDVPMPVGTTLQVGVAAPSGSGAGQGAVPLTTVPADVVTDISRTADSACAVTYKLSATVTAGVSPTDIRTVTFRLTD